MIERVRLVSDELFGLCNQPSYLLLIFGTAETFNQYVIATSFLKDAYTYGTRFILATVDKHNANLLRVTQITKSSEAIPLIICD